MTVNEKIKRLRVEMKKAGIDIYYIPTSDFHETEYVSDYFKCRKYISGFTGSQGVVVVTADEAGLWTDGRYYIQAQNEIADTEIILFRDGLDGVIKVDDYIVEKAFDGAVVGFDARVVNVGFAKRLKEKLSKKNVSFKIDMDLVGVFWEDRPPLPANAVWLMEDKYSGMSTAKKLSLVREDMKKEGATVHVLSVLDNISWLFNIRGGDISHFPVALSFSIITMDEALLFINPEVVSGEVADRLLQDNIIIKPYGEVYSYLYGMSPDEVYLLDTKKVNYRLYSSVPETAKIVDKPNPCVIRQACKNETEVNNTKEAHIKDGIAMVKFLCWIKKNVGKMYIDEVSAADYLEKLRREQGAFDLSFDTICAYGKNAAMMHYSATPENKSEIKPEGFLLVDSGGHYMLGSTDITRTIVLGPLSDRMKRMYTAVLRGNLALANAKFMYGCRGMNLDILARGPMWEMGLDYRCGTGHGVGYCLNVHEAPNGFRWKMVSDRLDSCVYEEGMITSDEPGYYEEGEFGIRIENEMVCRKAEQTQYGQFMEFETITYVPIDTEAIDMKYMTFIDIKALNSYHKMVYDTLSPYLEGEELEYLKNACREV